MKTRYASIAISLMLLLICTVSSILAQQSTAPPPPQPQPRPTGAASVAPAVPALPPDRRAYTDALRITDPQKKLEALEKYVADFPDSVGIQQANQQILTTLIKNWPDQTDRILAHAKKTISSAQEFAKPAAYSFVVTSLVEAGILLDPAEQFAKEGLTWVEEDQAKRLRQARAPHLSSLGRLYLKRGKLKEAEKFLKEAVAASPQLLDATIGLAELTEKKGDDAGALGYYATASLSGRMRAEVKEKFFALYRKSHNGTLNGIEDLLDTRYKKDFPNPVKVEHYTASATRTQRTLLAEVFTGSGCHPCVAADLAFDAFLERYSRKDVAVLMYHLHIPLPDPMTNPSTEARSKYYAVTGVPSYVLDGEKSSGGGSRDMTKGFYDRVRPTIETRLNIAAEATVTADATADATSVKVKATASGVKSVKAKLQIALAEDLLRYSGENGVRFHPMVVRSMAGNQAAGFAVEAEKTTSVEWTFDLVKITAELKTHLEEFELKRKDDNFAFSQKKHEIDPSNLTIVAFVQDDETKKVLQAVSIKLKPLVASVKK